MSATTATTPLGFVGVLTRDGNCSICGRPARDPYRRTVDGVVTEGCVAAPHAPYADAWHEQQAPASVGLVRATNRTCVRHGAECFAGEPSEWCQRPTACELCGFGAISAPLWVGEGGAVHAECAVASVEECPEYDDPYQGDTAYDRYCREQAAEYEALREGSATAIRNCYVCALVVGHEGMVDNHAGPFRAIVRNVTVNVADPTSADVLSCGHTVIDL